jgi:hypothetical protein
MADIVNEFEIVLVSYQDVKAEHPFWSDVAVEDYQARGRDVIRSAGAVNAINEEIVIIKARLDALEARVTYLEGSTVVTAVNITSSGNQVIICTDALTVTLAATPLDKDVVEVKVTNGKVIIDGNGNTIDGSDKVTVRRDNTGLSMEYSSTADAWYIL